jgi:calcium-dependent protein kinase
MLLSGYLPFEGTSQADVIQKVLNDPISFQESVWETVSEDAKDLLSHLIERDSTQRYSCEEILTHPWLSSGSTSVPVHLRIDRLIRYQKALQLKKFVLNFMATQCETEDIRNLAELFLRIDINRDGHLSLAELKQAFSNKNMDEEEFDNILASLDGDKNGSIDFTEFTAAVIGRGIYLCQEKLWNAFKRFDLNGNGRISAEEIKEVLDSGHFVKDSKVWLEMIKEVDLDGDGNLSFEEFVMMMDKELTD